MNETDDRLNRAVICFCFFIICSQSFYKLNASNTKTKEKGRKKEITKGIKIYSIVVQFAKKGI